MLYFPIRSSSSANYAAISALLHYTSIQLARGYGIAFQTRSLLYIVCPTPIAFPTLLCSYIIQHGILIRFNWYWIVCISFC